MLVSGVQALDCPDATGNHWMIFLYPDASMIDDMGIFRTTIQIAHLTNAERRLTLADVMVDTGSEYNWVPRGVLESLGVAEERVERFETADGRILTRPVGYAMIYAGSRNSPTIVVFAEPGDMVLLGAFGLEGLNLRIDLGRKELVPAGPVPAAAAA
jgi:predicted aspartyl protease